MKTQDLAAVTQWITAAAVQSAADLPSEVMTRLGIGRRSALTLLRKLAAAQWLVHEGTPRKGLWKPGALRQVVQRYPLDGLQEDLPWARDFAPFFALPADVARIAQHAFTELLNNAIDHSGGTQVTVSMRQTALHLQLLVSDDGCGVFQRIASAFDINEPTLAMLELSKGKLTSQPDRHTGRGQRVDSSPVADVWGDKPVAGESRDERRRVPAVEHRYRFSRLHERVRTGGHPQPLGTRNGTAEQPVRRGLRGDPRCFRCGSHRPRCRQGDDPADGRAVATPVVPPVRDHRRCVPSGAFAVQDGVLGGHTELALRVLHDSGDVFFGLGVPGW